MHMALAFLSVAMIGVAVNLLRNTNGIYSAHGQLGIFLCTAVAMQILLGIVASRTHDVDAKTESRVDHLHGSVGIIILGVGAVNILMGISQLNSIANSGSRGYLLGFVALAFAWFGLGIWLESKFGRSSRYFSQTLANGYGVSRKKKSLSSEEEVATVRGSIQKTSKVLTIEAAFKNIEEMQKNSPLCYRPSWDKIKVGNIEKVVLVEDFKKRPSDTKSPRESKVQIRDPSLEKIEFRNPSSEKIELKKVNSNSSLSSSGSVKLAATRSSSLLKLQADGPKGAIQKLSDRFGSGDLANPSRPP